MEQAELLGLALISSRPSALHWEGGLFGRRLSVWYRHIRRTKYVGRIRTRVDVGHRLQFDTECRSDGRMVIADVALCSAFTRWLNRVGGLQQVSVPSTLAYLEIWTSDTHWTQNILADHRCIEHIQELLPRYDLQPGTALQFYPDVLSYNSCGDAPALVQRFPNWAGNFAELAIVCGKLPKAAQKFKAPWLFRHPRLLVLFLALAVICGSFFLVFLLLSLLFMLA